MAAISFAQLRPSQTGTVIALFDPALSDQEVLQSISNNTDFLMSKGPTANSYIIRSDVANLPQRLNAKGAWLVLNYLGSAGCASNQPPSTKPFIKPV